MWKKSSQEISSSQPVPTSQEQSPRAQPSSASEAKERTMIGPKIPVRASVLFWILRCKP
jgi:hypothetical protein